MKKFCTLMIALFTLACSDKSVEVAPPPADVKNEQKDEVPEETASHTLQERFENFTWAMMKKQITKDSPKGEHFQVFSKGRSFEFVYKGFDKKKKTHAVSVGQKDFSFKDVAELRQQIEH